MLVSIKLGPEKGVEIYCFHLNSWLALKFVLKKLQQVPSHPVLVFVLYIAIALIILIKLGIKDKREPYQKTAKFTKEES